MSNLTVFRAQERIRQVREELADLEQQLEILQRENPDQQLARELHQVCCNANHTDGCGWFYEVHKGVDDWSGNIHFEWLKQARAVMKVCRDEKVEPVVAIRLFELIRGY